MIKNNQLKLSLIDKLNLIKNDDCSMYERLEKINNICPNFIAYDYMGKRVKYHQFIKQIKKCAQSFTALGISKGDSVTIAMPNIPEGITAIYACNYLGVIANMIHPLSAKKEIEFGLLDAKSNCLITINSFFEKYYEVKERLNIKHFIIAEPKNSLPFFKKILYNLTIGRKEKKILDKTANNSYLSWNKFLKLGKKVKVSKVITDNNAHALTLYSGGTTGTTKGIMLSNNSFNTIANQIVESNPMFNLGDKMLSAMPIFHGFGLGVCIHSMLANGGTCVLIPKFNPESYLQTIVKKKCNFIAGVPTLFEALLNLKNLNKLKLACLKGIFSGGDTLPIELKKRFDAFLKDHQASIKIREGYGTTECVTACCLTPIDKEKIGSIGLPFNGMKFIIVDENNQIVPTNTIGEILISGPSLMLGYVNNEIETKDTFEIIDGVRYIHTGDLACMDDEGYIFFKGRSKRMIISSGYNVYPLQLEKIIQELAFVKEVCVIGIPDPYRMARPYAYVVLNSNIDNQDNRKLKKQIIEHCKENLAKFEMPADIEFIDELPLTDIGKVNYRLLEEQYLNNKKSH